MTNALNILVVGSGAREHALASKISESPRCANLHVTPGNAGTPGTRHNVSATDINGIIALCNTNRISLVVVGPEAPLAAGIVDALLAAGIAAFGPTQALARLESDKSYARTIAHTLNMPSPLFASFTQGNEAEALAWWKNFGADIVVKQSGLAGGKGVVVPTSAEETTLAIREAIAVGDIVLEERLTGTECSLIAVSDGKTSVAFPLAQDHKRISDNDQGLNTGGMGAYSPSPFLNDADLERVGQAILGPWLEGCAEEGIDFKGLLYPGVMLTASGPKVLEFNARFGDPETQAYLPRLENDLVELLSASIDGTLDKTPIRWSPLSSLCVVIASAGYPGPSPKGYPIHGLKGLSGHPQLEVFHAGTALKDGEVVTAGGRVLGVTALGATLDEARRQGYLAADRIFFDGIQRRHDIGA